MGARVDNVAEAGGMSARLCGAGRTPRRSGMNYDVGASGSRQATGICGSLRGVQVATIHKLADTRYQAQDRCQIENE